MGYYTCKMLCCALKKDTPENVINTLKALVNSDDMPLDSVLSEEDFLTFRYGLHGYTNSYFIPHNSMEYDEYLGWRVFCNGESKDYEDEFEKCLEWLKPYISCGIGVDDMYAMTIGEGQNEPTIYKLYDGNEYRLRRTDDGKIEVKILHLPVKAKWFKMQESGEKPEEYREITPYWCKRLLGRETALFSYRNNYQSCNVKGYTHVCLRYGYTQWCFINRIDSITIGRGNPEWGAPTDRDVFIIKHHKEDAIVDGWKIDLTHKQKDEP